MEEFQHACDLRAGVVQEMRDNPELYNLRLDIEEDDDHLASMAKSGTWADERVHAAMAQVFKHDVLCVSWNPGQQNIFYYTGTDEFPHSMIIPMLYNGGNHYDLLEEAALLGQGIVPDHRLRQVREQVHKTSLKTPMKGKKRKAEEAKAEEGEDSRSWQERIRGQTPEGALKHKKVLDEV